MQDSDETETTYPLRAASKLTGLSPELLRAWERRYGVVEPLRTPGGTRRYRASDLERLKLVKAAVDAGHRISRVAQLEPAELEIYLSPAASTHPGLEPVLSALVRLDSEQAQRLMSSQLSALGPVRFAREFAIPLVHEIGERWAGDSLEIASEHMATAVLRSMLGSALRPTAVSSLGVRIIFATPTGEPHEIGLQAAALTAMGAGAYPIYLGSDLPVEDLLGAMEEARASVLALSIVTLPRDEAARVLRSLRDGLSDDRLLWVGGAGATDLDMPENVYRIVSLEELEQRVSLLTFEPPGSR